MDAADPDRVPELSSSGVASLSSARVRHLGAVLASLVLLPDPDVVLLQGT